MRSKEYMRGRTTTRVSRLLQSVTSSEASDRALVETCLLTEQMQVIETEEAQKNVVEKNDFDAEADLFD